MRIGHGFDAHRFADGVPLVLGGVKVPYEKGLAAHSDGDVVIHALCDALLGAAALGDIGKHFPDTSKKFENIDSRILLRAVAQKISEKGGTVANVDVTIVAEEPKLGPYSDAMRGNLAEDLGIDSARVSIKATTTEGMGFTGRGEGIAAFAVALLNGDA